MVKWSNTSSPKKKKEVKTAVIEASNNGIIDANVSSKLKISTAKTMAAIGALKIEPMATAAAAPISKVLVIWFKWKNTAMFEPIASPLATVLTSNPTQPPPTPVNCAYITDDQTWS